MNDFQFAEPGWIHALWAVLALSVALFWLERHAGRRFELLVSKPLQSRLVQGPSARQRNTRIVFLSLAALFAVVALMRPQWGFETIKTPRSSAELMIAIDVSRSMLAEDVVPNRLERAKAEVRDLLEFLHGDHVGLIAFAGRASVLAPMTPDFGFFRLVLDELGPHSAGRGGTRLEEPIRKAIQGFKATGDVSRVLLLITDGEDHDSFPLEAARDAAERGIRIIAIGFGSELGSEIPITDPRTGARTLLRDSSGQIVTSRLDGNTLREMALLTDGVYVPAATGALDLESIYDEHIKDLMRAEIDDQGQVVRSEGFQWAVLAALVCLVASVFAGQTSRRARNTPLAASLLLSIVLAHAPGPANAQDDANFPTPSAMSALPGEPAEIGEAEAGGESEVELERPAERDPREAYNDGLSALDAAGFDAADRHFEAARAASGTDGEARFRATYGLGWAAAARADSLLESQPDQALDNLYRAGDYFREAVRLQPANPDPRHNLEIILQRARVLADTLAKRDERDIAAILDELIKRQRDEAAGIRSLLEAIAAANQGAQLDDAFRQAFRARSTSQRLVLSDGDSFAERIAGEQSALESQPEDERSSEDQIRAMQLQQVQQHLQLARERMGHARRELRSRRGERAYRRVTAALAELKRARDQLRDPVQILDAILRDASELGRYTQAMSVFGSELPGLDTPPAAPPWLTAAYLGESQQNVNERTNELFERLAAGINQSSQPPAGEPASPEEARERAQQETLRLRVIEAAPHVEAGALAFEDALVALEVEDWPRGSDDQRRGLIALAKAREVFLDLRRLIEVSHADQLRLQSVIEPRPDPEAEGSETRGPEPDAREFLPALRELQSRNLERSNRIGDLIEEERQAIPLEPTEPSEGEEKSPAAAALERLDLADQVLLLAQSAMLGVQHELEEQAAATTAPEASATPERGEPPWPGMVEPGQQAVTGLESLRRLFFSIIEHLREVAQNQQRLNDETESVAALAGDDVADRLGPLVPRQSELAVKTGGIANALEEQSRQNPNALVDPDPSAADPESQQAAEEAQRLRRAAELTLLAQVEMEGVGSSFEAEEPDLEAARKQQDEALRRLIEALEALKPPEQKQQEQEEQEQQQQQEQEQEEQQQGQEEAQPQEQPAASDPSQLLQEVRDREAQRRREKTRRQQRQQNTVEKDW